ncbi:MAG: regulatory protein RecX [Candidatus Limnocylindrus sp.]
MRRRKDPALIKERHATADASAVLEAAARSLSGAPRTKRALAERLIKAGYPEEHVITATDRLEAVGIIDDERLARSLVESRDRSRQRGDRALAQELRRRGVPEEIALRVLAERSDEADGDALREGEQTPLSAEERAAYAAAARVRLRGGDARAEVQRVAQALARRGFPSGLSWRIARERVAGAGEGIIPLQPPEGLGEAD